MPVDGIHSLYKPDGKFERPLIIIFKVFRYHSSDGIVLSISLNGILCSIKYLSLIKSRNIRIPLNLLRMINFSIKFVNYKNNVS